MSIIVNPEIVKRVFVAKDESGTLAYRRTRVFGCSLLDCVLPLQKLQNTKLRNEHKGLMEDKKNIHEWS